MEIGNVKVLDTRTTAGQLLGKAHCGGVPKDLSLLCTAWRLWVGVRHEEGAGGDDTSNKSYKQATCKKVALETNNKN